MLPHHLHGSAQRRGQGRVVLGQARHLRAQPLDLPPQDLDLLQASACAACCVRSRSDCSDNRRKAVINCRCSASIELPHSLDGFAASRPPTPGGRSSEPGGSTKNVSPSVTRSSTRHVIVSNCVKVWRACSMSTSRIAGPEAGSRSASTTAPRPPTSAAHDQKETQTRRRGQEPRPHQQDPGPFGPRRHIGVDGTSRAPRSAAQALAKPPQLRRPGLLDLPPVGLPLPPQPGGQVVLARRHARTTLPSPATASRSPGRGRSRSPCPAAALRGRLPSARRRRRRGSRTRPCSTRCTR